MREVLYVIPRLPVRRWVRSVPKRLRYHLERDPAVLNAALHIFFTAIERVLRQHSRGASAAARLGAVVCIHRFGALLNTHLHFHCVVVDGVFDVDAGGGVTFHRADGLDAWAIGEVQVAVRRRLLRAALRRGLLWAHGAQVMTKWERGGGFSVDAKVRIQAHERDGLERLLRYCARPAFALERLREIDGLRERQARPKGQCQPDADADADAIAESPRGADSAAAQTSASRLRRAGTQRACAMRSPHWRSP